MKWKNEKEKLTELIIEQKLSYEEIGRIYGVTGTAIKKAAQRLGIALISRRRINPKEKFNNKEAKKGKCLNCGEEFIIYLSHTGKYCSNKCQKEYQYKQYIEEWKTGNIDGTTKAYTCSDRIRRYLMEKNHYKCEICGWGEVNPRTGLIPLQIHHIDGDCTNNKEENLQLLCPNCHALTENYGSLNSKGNKERAKLYHYDKDSYYEKVERRKRKKEERLMREEENELEKEIGKENSEIVLQECL